MAKLETQIHAWLVHNAGGKQLNVKGTSQTTLSKMKTGKSGITTKNLSAILEANGHEGVIIIKAENGQRTTINLTKIKSEDGTRGA